jgi:hypothetical protein
VTTLRRMSLALSLAAVALGLISIINRARVLAEPHARNDFTTDYASAREWIRDGRPYDPIEAVVERSLGFRSGGYVEAPGGRNPHTPMSIVVLAPLGFLDHRVAIVSWMFLSSLGAAVAFALLARRLGWSMRASIVAGVGSLAIPSVHSDLLYGSASVPVLLLLVAAWCAADDGRDRTAGILLGVATALRLFPIFLVLPLLRSNRWQTVKWQIFTAAALSIAGAAAIGVDGTRVFSQQAASGNWRFWRAAPQNLSLVSLPFRWLTPNRWNSSAASVPLLAALIALLLGTVCVIAALRTRAAITRSPIVAAVPWMLLASPLSWYVPLGILPVAVACKHSITGRRDIPPILLCAAAVVFLVGQPPGLPDPLPGISVASALGYAVPLFATVAFAVSDLGIRAGSESEPLLHAGSTNPVA